MSNAQTREDIAAALSEVPGVTGYARRPKTFKPGDGWPRWTGSDREAGTAYFESWAVIIVVPSDEGAADAFVDSHGELLEDALRPVLYIETFQPAGLPAEGQNVINALMITGKAE
jgi:hypothetical protein